MDKSDKISQEQLLFAILDNKSLCFGPPFLARTKGDALRSFDSLVNSRNPDSLITQFPDDFMLYHIGSFDMGYGILKPVGMLEVIGKGSDFVKQAPVA